jgi:hypothetical protein
MTRPRMAQAGDLPVCQLAACSTRRQVSVSEQRHESHESTRSAPTIDELAGAQDARVVGDSHDLADEICESDDELEVFLADLCASRNASLASSSVADVVIDTDVASVLQKNRAPAWVHRHVTGTRVWLTFVTVVELTKWPEVRSWGAPAC